MMYPTGMASFKVSLIAGLLSLAAMARGSTVGNGGYGVRVDGIIYALDLAARGVSQTPYMSADATNRLDPAHQVKMRDLISQVANSDDILLGVELKLAILEDKALAAGFVLRANDLVDTMGTHTWFNLQMLPCLDVGDSTQPFPDQVQLAFRQDTVIRFCREFNQLESKQKIALIVHEIVYAQFHDGQPHITNLVGLLFDPRIQALNADLRQELQGELTALAVPKVVTGLQLVRTLRGHIGTTRRGVDLSTDGKFALTAGDAPENTVRIWLVETGENVGSFALDEGADLPRFTEDATRLYVVGRWYHGPSSTLLFPVTVKDWNGQTRRQFAVTAPTVDSVPLIDFSKDRSRVIVMQSSWIGIFDSLNGHQVDQFTVGSCRFIDTVRDVPETGRFVVGCADTVVSVDRASGNEQILLNYDTAHACVGRAKPWLTLSDTVISSWMECMGTMAAHLTLATVSTGQVQQIPVNSPAATSLGTSSDGRIIIVREGNDSFGYKFKLWDLAHGNEILEFRPPNGNIYAAEFIPGTNLILEAGGPNPAIYTWTNSTP